MSEILYGIRKSDGKIISISEILTMPDPDVMRGSKCDCLCPHPGCGSPLLARLGKGIENGGNQPHFAHQKGYEPCDITYANESALHLMAKEIIAEECKFATPPVKITHEEAEVEDIPLAAFNEVPIYCPIKGGIFDCVEVQLEKHVSFIVPDIIAKTRTGQCLIEICVTHPVSLNKKKLLAELRLPTLEIDLSDYKDKAITRDELRDILLKPNNRMRWIYYKGQEDALRKARDYYRNHKKVLAYLEEQRKKREIKKTSLKPRPVLGPFRRIDEATKQARLLAKQQKAEEMRLRIENANYDQDDEPIWDSDDPKTRIRYMKCVSCEKKIPGFKMSRHVSLNRGICRECFKK